MQTPNRNEQTIDAAERLLDKDPVRPVFDAINRAGGEARLVGGVVRDALLDRRRRKARDIDMATTLPPDKATEVLEAAGLHVIPTGIDYGTVTVRRRGAGQGGVLIELTTLREDIETDGRRAKVRFGSDWVEDARRRDFTINSMSLASDGTLYDPFGGLGDLEESRVRFVGDARQRIREDYLRILRFFRFHARFGDSDEPDAEAMEAISELAGGLDGISGERMAKEILAMLDTGTFDNNEDGTVGSFNAMAKTSVDRSIAPGGFRLKWLRDLLFTRGFWMTAAFRLGHMLDPEDVEPVAGRLRLSRRDSMELLLGTVDIDVTGFTGEDWEVNAWRRMRDLPGKPSARNLARVLVASASRRCRTDAFIGTAIRLAWEWDIPEFPLKGKDLRERGISTGRELGDELRRLEEEWVGSGFRLDRGELLDRLDTAMDSG